MSTQIQQQQVQGLVSAVSGISANAGNLAYTGSTLTAEIAAEGYRLDTDIETVSGILISTGSALHGEIVSNRNNIATTGGYLFNLISGVSNDLSNSGAYLTTTIINTGALLTTNLIATGATLTTNLIDTGAFLTTNLIATGATLTTNLIDTGAYLQSEVDTANSGISQNSGAAHYANYSLASNFRLNDYVLQTSLTGIPTGTLKEASSVCYNPSGRTYLVLSPDPIEEPSIKEFEFGGTGLVRSTIYRWPTNYSDIEGITHVTGNQFALCSEYNSPTSSKDAILLFDYIGNTGLGGTIASGSFTPYDVASAYSPSPISNAGLEGISYNPQKQVFYGGFEGNGSNSWKVCEITLSGAPPPQHIGGTTSVQLFSRASVNWPTSLSRISDIYYDPNSKHLFLTDHGHTVYPNAEHSRVFECDLEGNFIDYVDLKDSQGNHYNQIEGITFSPDGGRMVIAGEAGDDVASDLGYYTISSFATSGAYKIPAVTGVGGLVTATRLLTSADHGTYIHCLGSPTLTLPTPDCSGQFDGFQCDVFNEGAGSVTITGAGAGDYRAKGHLLATQYTWAKVWCLSGMWYAAGDLTV